MQHKEQKVNIKHDDKGRITYQFEPFTETLFLYEYFNDEPNYRIATIINNKNESNFRTVKSQSKKDENIWMDIISKEYGEVYYILKHYNEEGQEILFKQINLNSDKIFKKKLLFDEKDCYIWLSDYSGKKNIEFNINKKTLKQWKKIK